MKCIVNYLDGLIRACNMLLSLLFLTSIYYKKLTCVELCVADIFTTFSILSKGDQTVTFSQVVIEVMRQLEGAYALIFKSPHYPDELVACKRGSTLILGLKVSLSNIFYSASTTNYL